MLDRFKFTVICMCCVSSSFWPHLKANPLIVLSCKDDSTDICSETAERMEQEFDLDELIRMIVELREYMLSNGCYFPRLSTFLDSVRVSLERDGIEIDDLAFDALKAEFERYERDNGCSLQQIRHHHKNKKKKDKEVKISSKMACGFLKFVGGSLLCLVPIPTIQGAGASLAIVGISEMVDASRHESDKKEWEERMDANRRIDNGMDQR